MESVPERLHSILTVLYVAEHLQLYFPDSVELLLLLPTGIILSDSSGLTSNSVGYSLPYYLASSASAGGNSEIYATRYEATHGFARAENLYKSRVGSSRGPDDIVFVSGSNTVSSDMTIWGLQMAYGVYLEHLLV